MTVELKPCPFCGGTVVLTGIDHDADQRWGFAMCGDCGARSSEVITRYNEREGATWRAEAIAAWNTRAGEKQ